MLRACMGADISMLGADLFRVNPTENHAVTVELTMIGGRVTFRR